MIWRIRFNYALGLLVSAGMLSWPNGRPSYVALETIGGLDVPWWVWPAGAAARRVAAARLTRAHLAHGGLHRDWRAGGDHRCRRGAQCRPDGAARPSGGRGDGLHQAGDQCQKRGDVSAGPGEILGLDLRWR